MCIRDSSTRVWNGTTSALMKCFSKSVWIAAAAFTACVPFGICLLYTSPSPRDRTRSSSSAASDVYKRQLDESLERHDLRPYEVLLEVRVDRGGRLHGVRPLRDLSLIHISEPTRPY